MIRFFFVDNLTSLHQPLLFAQRTLRVYHQNTIALKDLHIRDCPILNNFFVEYLCALGDSTIRPPPLREYINQTHMDVTHFTTTRFLEYLFIALLLLPTLLL